MVPAKRDHPSLVDTEQLPQTRRRMKAVNILGVSPQYPQTALIVNIHCPAPNAQAMFPERSVDNPQIFCHIRTSESEKSLNFVPFC